ncbi:MAG: serine protease [Candidatus Electrothrix sp. GM3_4]|nr:serine protease [Candidatus Electrothrix sp. GM3_4]
MNFFVTFCCTTLSLLMLCGNAAAGNNIEFLDKELIQHLNHGIYEVVIPKMEDEKIIYARKLPFEKLGYVERNEKYHSIGTAFFINGKELMTAEHVFGLRYFSLNKAFFIRDRDDQVYPVDTVRKCSTRRDMLIFDLKEYPEKITPLHFNRQVEVGDTVFSAGNALGEGISYRAGQVASFTPEWDYGEWQDIRFTSPASPGNSGGPLLNTAGEVVGVVVQRRNQGENYNVAVPISEADNLGDKAEFHSRNVTERIRGTVALLTKDWDYKASLPATVPQLARQTQDALMTFHRTLRKELRVQVQEKNFPEGQRFRYYLRNQPVIHGLATVTPDIKFRKWTAKQVKLDKEPLAEGQNVYHGPNGTVRGANRYRRPKYSDMQVIAEKPKGTDLKTFLDSPALILETVLSAVPYFRYIGRERIPVTSLGSLNKTEVWRDKLGRRWTSSLWYVPYADDFLYSSCLPFPKGAVCTINRGQAGQLTQDYIVASHEKCDKMVVGYKGSIDDWGEYLALGDKYLPAFFQQAEISHKGDQIKIRLKDFQIDFKNPAITGDSSLRLHLGYANDQLLAEDLVLFSLFKGKGSPASYSVRPRFEPSPFSSDAYTGKWEESIAGTGDFSGKKLARGNQIVIRKTASQTEKMITDPHDQELKKIFTIGCTYKASAAEDVEKDCESFFQSIDFTGK